MDIGSNNGGGRSDAEEVDGDRDARSETRPPDGDRGNGGEGVE